MSDRRTAQDLPPEVLLHILDVALVGRVRNVEPFDAAGRGPRNDVLLRTGLVSKAWASASQYLLYRDLFVGSETHDDLTTQSPVETSSLPQLLKALARLPTRDHVRSAHLEVGHGFSLRCLGEPHDRYTDIMLPEHVDGLQSLQLNWAPVELVQNFLSLCPNVQHLGITIADPVDGRHHAMAVTEPFTVQSQKTMGSLQNLHTLSFVYKAPKSILGLCRTADVLETLLSLAGNLTHLYLNMNFGPDIVPLNPSPGMVPAELKYLRELRSSGPMIPSFMTMPVLETLVWRRPNPAHWVTTGAAPSTIRSLSIGGDEIRVVPDFLALPRLLHLLIDADDRRGGLSYRDETWRDHGAATKLRYITLVLKGLPPGLECFTIVESFAMRLVPRDVLCGILLTWTELDPPRLPRKFQLLHRAGDLPLHYSRRELASTRPLYEDPLFRDLETALKIKGVEVVTVRSSHTLAISTAHAAL